MIKARISRCACRAHGIAHRVVEVCRLTRCVGSPVVDRTTLRQNLAIGEDMDGVHLDATCGHIRAGGGPRGCNGEIDDIGRRSRRISSQQYETDADEVDGSDGDVLLVRLWINGSRVTFDGPTNYQSAELVLPDVEMPMEIWLRLALAAIKTRPVHRAAPESAAR